MIDRMFESVDMDNYEVVTIYLGEGVDEARGQELGGHIQERFPDLESVEIAPGGQPFYDYIISVE